MALSSNSSEVSSSVYDTIIGNCLSNASPASCVLIVSIVVIIVLFLCFLFACYGISKGPDPITFYDTVLTLTQPIVTVNAEGEFVVRPCSSSTINEVQSEFPSPSPIHGHSPLSYP